MPTGTPSSACSREREWGSPQGLRVSRPHDNIPVYARRQDEVAARLYNLWRRARRKLGSPLRVELPGLKGLALVLSDGGWICIDPQLNDIPILAWTNFATQGRDTLHVPVPCELNYYHLGATMVRAKVLELMELMLEERLRRATSPTP